MRALALLTFVTGCNLSSVSRETDDMGPTGLVITDGGDDAAPADLGDAAQPASEDLTHSQDLLARQDLAVPPGPPSMLTHHNDNQPTGAEKFGGPVDLDGTVPGSGWGSPDGLVVKFDPQYAFQRPALLMANGNIYAAFGGHCDHGDYHGWIMAYDAKTMHQTAIWNS